MVEKQANVARICDFCGEAYFGKPHGKYNENICPECAKSKLLSLITEDHDDSEIPDSLHDELDGGKGDDEDGD